MQTEIPEGKGRGHWQRVLLDAQGDSPCWSAIIWCPDCGRILALQRGHAIATNGQITPSVGHPDEYPACPWHTHPRLLGWSVLPTPPQYALETCEQCGAQSRSIGGWGTWSGGRGLICRTCFDKRMVASGS
jgi:hypothetical protein